MSMPPDMQDPNTLHQPYFAAPDMGPDGDLNGGPINLDALRDGPPGTKPFYPYSTLIRYAIKGSPNQKLLLEDIYYAIESRFPYFRTAPAGWKNSIRHNLSLNPCFVKVPRPLTDRGKGSYWTVDDNVDPRTGVHRIRKRGGGGGATSISKRGSSSRSADDSYDAASPDGSEGPSFALTADMPMLPVLDTHEQIIWKNAWLNELSRLRAFTHEQEKTGVDDEWFKQLVYGVRNSLATLVPADADAANVDHDQA
ncbi:hypothetical protein EXIGLDRAFT_828023 [Exidia glandulosa HHB12029]|uniref:Fork-head domain-containing protein n=1 Tax=Exidia glandulosa HHB12029 TaxID=1314781 RepID=A0A165QUQ3_EXIGL|nr:hypothetical protein EXIGLDRAFT_828023 [Exidia glandulosa HHB12029]